jgi:branched-chain amino acid transport system ATP-binding protein
VTPVLDVQHLGVSYGKISALRDASVRLNVGQIVTIIGPNGAGKTTLLKAIMGMIPSQGSISLRGEAIVGLEIEERVERGLLLVPETRELFADMSVADNLMLGAYPHRRRKSETALEMEKIYDLFPRLRERKSQMAGTMSGGERQMLALGRALMGRPKVLMLDEPSLGLAPIIVREIFRIIARLRSLGVATLLVEQNARAALETADYGYVLETGDIVRQGAAEALLSDQSLTELYLGGEVSETPVAR